MKVAISFLLILIISNFAPVFEVKSENNSKNEISTLDIVMSSKDELVKETNEIKSKQALKPIVKPLVKKIKPKAKIDRVKVSNSDKDLLARLVTAEAKNQPFNGQVAVAAVVLNRVESHNWPNSIKKVIYQKRQFSPVSNGSIKKKATSSAVKAVESALNGKDPSNGAVYFYNPKIADRNPNLKSHITAVIGDHIFLN